MNKKDYEKWLGVADLLYHPKTAALLKQDMAMAMEASEAVTDEQRKEKLIASLNDEKIQHDLNDARLFQVTNDVLAHTFALSFLEYASLAENEWPIVWNENIDKNFRVTYLGEDGGAPKRQTIERKTHSQFLMKTLATEEAEFPLYNIQTGRHDLMQKVNARLAYELNLKLDKEARSLLDLAANAKTSGLRATLNLHPDIIAANIPDANYLDHSGVGTAGIIDVEKIKRILDYIERFTAETGDDLQPLQIKTIYIPSVQKRDFWDMCDLVAGFNLVGAVQDPKNVIPTDARMQVWRSGKLEQMFGYQFAIVTRNTIAAPYGYISTNKPCGWFWDKPTFGQVVQNNSNELVKKNKSSLWMKKVIQMAIPSEYAHRFIKWKY